MTDHTAPPTPAFWREPEGPRLPRIALMGEFSAGKSTLANLMIGTNPLPVQVVATQMPPVWISYGSAPSVIVDLEGNETTCDLETLQEIVPENIAFIRFYCEEEILRKCEIIDMPGISDPNMASKVWERIMPFADGVLWCSPATQAWRQSEAAVWNGIDAGVRENSLLVLTRGDMLLTDRDKNKVLKRVKAEAGSLFADVLMISLSLARDAGDDEELWALSGADEFVSRFVGLVDDLGRSFGTGDAAGSVTATATAPTAPPEEKPQTDPAVTPRRPSLRRSVIRDTSNGEADRPDPLSFMPKFS